MEMNKLTMSLSTIPNESKLYYSSTLVGNSLQQIHTPYRETLPLKMPKRHIRMRTNGHIAQETIQNPEKSCIRNYQHANHSRVFDEPQPQRRAANPGLFHSLSRESLTYRPLNRSVEDLGAPNNRKKIHPYIHTKPDPITIGERCTKHNSALQKTWAEPRRHRDNGKNCSETLNWDTKRSKNTYLQMYKPNSTKNAGTALKKFSILC